MYDANGSEDGVTWSIKYHGGRNFTVSAQNHNSFMSENYECGHEPIFGVDVSDQKRVNDILDRFINELKSQ